MICYFSKPPLRSWAELQRGKDMSLAFLPTLHELDPLLRTPLTCKTKAGPVSQDSDSTPVLNCLSPQGFLWSGMSHLLGFCWQHDDLEHRSSPTQQDTVGCICFGLCLTHTNSPSAPHCSTQRGKSLAIKPELSPFSPLKAWQSLLAPPNPKPQTNLAQGPQQHDWLLGLLGFPLADEPTQR